MAENELLNRKCSKCEERKLLSEFNLTYELDDKRASICKSCMIKDLEEASSENWDDVAYVCNLIESTLQKNHEQFRGEGRFSNVSATAGCYAVIERLSSIFINHFGTEAIELLIEKLNTFQTALILNLEKFRDR